ncbi:hypothetical protein GL2_32880 [Microbulbifer sp. GL-2]|nr:hypothetical protein GL2_32880 [Microbulbifer sp. GL-2]
MCIFQVRGYSFKLKGVPEMKSLCKVCAQNKMGLGIAFGVAIGMGFGAATGDMVQTIGLGVALGVLFGALWTWRVKREVC